jgi:predicted nucleic acid-binding Zn finger protein
LHHSRCLVGNHFHIHSTTIDLSRVIFINCSEGITFVLKMNFCSALRCPITIVMNKGFGNRTDILKDLKAIIFSKLWVQVSKHNTRTSS